MLRILFLVLLLSETLVAQTIQLQQHELNQRNGWGYITIRYPQVQDDDSFNAAVRQTVTDSADEFRKGLVEDDSSKGVAYLNGKYSANVVNNNSVISVLFEYDEYVPLAAHPWGVMVSLNYDARTHRVLALSDLFRPGSNYVSRLSKTAIASLEQRDHPEKAAIRDGAGPKASNFKVFTLTDSELILHFQQNQVAPSVVPFGAGLDPAANVSSYSS